MISHVVWCKQALVNFSDYKFWLSLKNVLMLIYNGTRTKWNIIGSVIIQAINKIR